MRNATKEEKDSVNRYIESISKPTGANFYDKEDDIAKIIYDNLNGWGISMQTSKRIAKEILENIGE